MIAIHPLCNWTIFETDNYKVFIKLDCPDIRKSPFPGTSYLHPDGLKLMGLRERATAGDTELYVDNYETEVLGSLVYPRKLLIDPDGEQGVPFMVEALNFNAPTRSFTLSSPLPSNAGVSHVATWRKGTGIGIWLAEEGILTGGSIIGDLEIEARLREERPHGIWIIDPGGVNEERVLVIGTSYRRRGLSFEIDPLATRIRVDLPLGRSEATGYVSVVDETGTLGTVVLSGISLTDGRDLNLGGVAGFSSALGLREAHVELVEGMTLGSKLKIGNPLKKVHLAGEVIRRDIGSGVVQPEYGDIGLAGWPNYPADGRFPGGYLHTVDERCISNEQGTGLVLMTLDRTDVNDMRSYLCGSRLTKRFDSSFATLYKTVGSDRVVEMEVESSNGWPTEVQVDAWRFDVVKNPGGKPPRIALANEGRFGREPFYYWGYKNERVIYVSGVQRVHQAGVGIGMYQDEIAIKMEVGTLGGSPGIEDEEGSVLVDFGTDLVGVIFYDGITVLGVDRGLLKVERGYVVEYEGGLGVVEPIGLGYENKGEIGHNRDRRSHLERTTEVGVKLVRSEGVVETDKAGYSFPFYLGGNILLMRIKYLLGLVRSAGVEVILVDEKDQEIDVWDGFR